MEKKKTNNNPQSEIGEVIQDKNDTVSFLINHDQHLFTVAVMVCNISLFPPHPEDIGVGPLSPGEVQLAP